MAYTSDESGRNEVYIVPFPSGVGKWQVSSTGGAGSHWRKDGGELIYFTTDTNKLAAVPIEAKGNTINIGTPVPLFDISRSGGRLDISADHQRIYLAMSPTARAVDPLTLVTNWPATLHAPERRE
jgi:hypothetical protein